LSQIPITWLLLNTPKSGGDSTLLILNILLTGLIVSVFYLRRRIKTNRNRGLHNSIEIYEGVILAVVVLAVYYIYAGLTYLATVAFGADIATLIIFLGFSLNSFAILWSSKLLSRAIGHRFPSLFNKV